MKSLMEYWSRVKSTSSGINANSFQAAVTDLLADLAELQRLESEPRARWEPVGKEQCNGAYHIVGRNGYHPKLAAHRGGRWESGSVMLVNEPTHYLANIPPVPAAVAPVTADEWAKAAADVASTQTFPESTLAMGRLKELLKRHTEASK